MKLEEKKLPKGWEVKRLGEVCIYSKGKMPKVLTEEKNEKCSVPYINIKAFEKGIFSEYTNGEKCNLCDDDDLLMVWDGARCGLIGKAKKGAVGSTLMKILPREIIHKGYLYYFISSKFRTLNTKPRGVGIPHIEPSLLWNFELFLPPLPEQQQIVAKIEELFSELENGKKELLIAQAKLKTYRQSLLKWAFEGRLTNKNLKEGELPKGWEVKKLGEVCKINPKLPNKDQINSDLEIQFLPMKLVEEVINKISLTETRTFIEVQKRSYTPFIDEDIIFAKVTPCMENGKIAVVKNLKNGIGFGSSEFHVVRCSESVLNKFIFYFLVRDKFRNEAASEMTGAVGLRRVPKQFIENYSINLPPLPEQQKIVAILESKLTICDAIEETIKTSIKQGEALRQSILKKAFEGKLINKKNVT